MEINFDNRFKIPFNQQGKSLTPEIKGLLDRCIAMLETYYDKMKNAKGNVRLEGQDKTDWLQNYYPNLVQSGPKLPDDRFFYPNGEHPDFGIGNDGVMSKYDYCQFLYRAYRLAIDPLTPDRIVTAKQAHICAKVAECLVMLETYLPKVAKSPLSGTYDMTAEHRKCWNTDYYPLFVKNGLIPDAVFFGAQNNESNMGIGNDVCFTGCELLHFLYECAKFLYQNI